MKNHRLWAVLGIGLLATILWDSPLLLPLKLLIVLVHEIWHGLAAVLSGAFLTNITVNFAEWGETSVSGLYSSSGFIFTVSAGYIGTALVGGILLNRGLMGRLERIGLGAFAGLLFYMSYLFTVVDTTAFYTGMGWSLFLMLPIVFGRRVSRYMLIVLGTAFIWYSVYDIFDFTRDVTSTDAGILARYIFSKDWLTQSDPVALSVYISIIWTACMLLLVGLTLWPALSHYTTPVVTSETPAPVEPTTPEFPAEITPEVQEWFLANGFGLDGRPLPPELLDEMMDAEPESTARVNTAAETIN